MNKPSERIVVFVTPAQKLAIASTAERLGISVSELMRRAVLSFGATSEQVKAASIVDRLNAPREPDALNAALQRVAAASKRTNARNNAAAQALAGAKRAAAAQPDNLQDIAGAQAHDDARAPLHAAKADPTEAPNPFDETDSMRDPSLPDAFAVTHPADDDTDEEAVARVTAAWRAQAGRDAADTAPGSGTRTPSPVVPSAPSAVRRAKPSTLADDNEDDSSPDPTAEGGRFA